MLKLMQSRFCCRFLFFLTCLLFFPLLVSAQQARQEEDDPFAKMRDAIFNTGVVRDATPALFRPRYLSVSDASLSMEDTEPVFLAPFFPDGIMRIYPQRIMLWHEVVNDYFDNTNELPVAITYCPITGSLAAYNLHSTKRKLSLGVSGELLNDNSILYDHFSGSLWPQLTGQAIDGPFKGRILPRLPVIWTTWGKAKSLYSNGMVLSRTTGYRRSYGKDPYGNYSVPDSYYDDLNIFYPVMSLDKRLPPKTRMVCVEFDGLSVAVNKAEVKKEGAVNFSMGITPMLAAYDPLLDTVRIFGRHLEKGNITLNFSWSDDGLVDNETRTVWNNEGLGIEGTYRGTQLTPFITVDSMWFAWAAFYPQTRIVPGKEF